LFNSAKVKVFLKQTADRQFNYSESISSKLTVPMG
jgi:hypothetical protein